MILKIISLFLIFMGVLAMFGKLGILSPKLGRKRVATCKSCGAHIIGKGPCACKKKDV